MSSDQYPSSIYQSSGDIHDFAKNRKAQRWSRDCEEESGPNSSISSYDSGITQFRLQFDILHWNVKPPDFLPEVDKSILNIS